MALSCSKDDEPKYSIVGRWVASGYGQILTFPKSGIIDVSEKNEFGYSYTSTYKCRSDSLFFINTYYR